MVLGLILAADPALAEQPPKDQPQEDRLVARQDRHRVTCDFDYIGGPVKQGRALGGQAVIQCTGKLDGAGTVATVQVMEHDGTWRDYGNPSDTAARGPRIRIYDGAPGRKGCYWYRMAYVHSGQHDGIRERLRKTFSRATRQCF